MSKIDNFFQKQVNLRNLGLLLFIGMGIVLVLSVSFVTGVEKKAGPVVLTHCTDTDAGDKPGTPGKYSWEYVDVDPRGGRGSASMADACSFSTWYVLRYVGEPMRLRDNILVEGVCAPINTTAENPGELQRHMQKFYKCDCDNIRTEIKEDPEDPKGTRYLVGYCKGPVEEIPASRVYEAYERWERDGRPRPPFIIRILQLLGWWG